LKAIALRVVRTGFGKSDYESLRAWILSLPDVTEAPHRFGGTEFQVKGLEFMHSHGHAQLDIRLSKDDQARVLNEGRALKHRFAPDAGWVTLIMRSYADVAGAKGIIELSYRHAEKTMLGIEAKRRTHSVRN